MTTILGDRAWNDVGPFTVLTENYGRINAHCRCWLTSDPERKVLCEGSPRELEAYFNAVCSQATVGESLSRGADE